VEYVYTRDSERKGDVPRGDVYKREFRSQIFGGTARDYWLYVPAQYRPDTPAALMVFQDGHAYASETGDFRVPIVFDNLIHKGEMPVTLGLFINPGHAGKAPPEGPWGSDNRSYEYDSLTEKYSRFIIEEMLVEVEKTHRVSADPKQRAIGGMSSGGICAFTVAWQRPDCFHRVLSHVGSFTDIRGGHNYPFYIRQWAKRDLKVFLQSGENDLETQFGNWWLGNLQMASALAWRKYDHKFVGGKGGHDGKHGGAILPDSLRWLWDQKSPS
jgi:enterochelin esterase-like enzyme